MATFIMRLGSTLSELQTIGFRFRVEGVAGDSKAIHVGTSTANPNIHAVVCSVITDCYAAGSRPADIHRQGEEPAESQNVAADSYALYFSCSGIFTAEINAYILAVFVTKLLFATVTPLGLAAISQCRSSLLLRYATELMSQ